MIGRLVAATLAVLAIAAAVVAAWPSPRHGSRAVAAVAAPVLDAARVPAFVSQTVAISRLGQRLDAVVANRGQREVIGIGRVVGPYYFVPDQEYGHRLPIDRPAPILVVNDDVTGHVVLWALVLVTEGNGLEPVVVGGV